MPRKLKCKCGRCPTCYQREWRRRNPQVETPEQAERRRARNRKWAKDNATRMADLQREWYEENREHVKAKLAERVAADPQYHAKRSKRFYWADPEKARLQARARNAVSYAIRVGKLQRGPCEVCGTTESIHAHHDDHTRPLDVRWLCRRHHIDHHLEIKKAKKAK